MVKFTFKGVYYKAYDIAIYKHILQIQTDSFNIRHHSRLCLRIVEYYAVAREIIPFIISKFTCAPQQNLQGSLLLAFFIIHEKIDLQEE